ncbi:MAG: bifunctional pyr operon transcriptional regulator/uracil phosphoribosyltransferase PyrR [bacterium]
MAEEELTRETLMSEAEMNNCIQRLGYQILEKYPEEPIAFVGIYTRGVDFANRLYDVVSEQKPNVKRGTLDITLYRDDLDNLGTMPSVKSSDIPFEVEDSRILLLDDVLFTGRTCRAAIDVIMDYGRPSRIELGVLVDRGHRELPICPDYTGLSLETSLDQYINVRFQETDDSEGIFLLKEHGEESN